jgi:hypothetical protein
MLSRWGRLMLAFAAALAVWAIATPAFAAAPLCDPRGATGIAPAPQLQQPESSLDVGQAADDCDGFNTLTASFDDGRAPEPAPASAPQDELVPNVAPVIALAASGGSFARDGTSASERAGARSRVDRPPRG